MIDSVVNGFLVWSISFRFGRTNENGKNSCEPVIEKVIILGFLSVDTSSKPQKYTYFV